jgi:hypothetical protein
MPKGQSKMVNPEKLVTEGTQDEDKHEALKSPPMKIDLAKSGCRTLSKNISGLPRSTKCQFLSIYDIL